jgi:hypothetical protein
MVAAVLLTKIIYINSLIQKVQNVEADDIFQVKLSNRVICWKKTPGKFVEMII